MKRTYMLLATGCGLLFAASTCFAQMYVVTNLGTLGGSNSTASSSTLPARWLAVPASQAT